MSHQRLLTSAAWPRRGTPPVVRRLTLFLLVFLSLAAGAPFAAAEMVYYTEDFVNDGEPGFDPVFNHEFIEPAGYPDYMYPMWSIRPPCPGFSEVYRLALIYGTRDSITFNLEPSEQVAWARVTVTPELSSLGYVKFIGTNGEWQTSANDYGQKQFEVSQGELGYIESIELYATQGGLGVCYDHDWRSPRAHCLIAPCCAVVCFLDRFVVEKAESLDDSTCFPCHPRRTPGFHD